MSFHALGMNDLEGNGIATTVDEATKKGEVDLPIIQMMIINLKHLSYTI